MNVNEIVENIDYIDMIGHPDSNISGITSNSNDVKQGYMFCAIRGDTVDGHSYISSAIENGATSIVLEKMPEELKENITYIVVENTRTATPVLASRYYHDPTMDMKLVGITGTNGKTTITYILDAIWREEGKDTGVIGTIENIYGERKFNASMTTPDSIELIKLLNDMREYGVGWVSMEVSSHALDRHRVDGCNLDAAVFTNLSQDHLDYHITIDNYFNSKKKLFTEILQGSRKKNKVAVINVDDPYGLRIAEGLGDNIVSYSVVNQASSYHAADYSISNEGVTAEFQTPEGSLEICSNLIGRHNLYNLLASVGVAHTLGTPLETIDKALSKKITVPGRLEKIENQNGMDIFVDYAHTPDALENVISALLPLKRGKLITVFGCGGDRDREKRPIMGEIGIRLSDSLIITSDNPRTEDPESIINDIESGILNSGIEGKDYIKITDRSEAIKRAIDIADKGDIVVIAGKGHEDYQIIGETKIDFDDRQVAARYLEN